MKFKINKKYDEEKLKADIARLKIETKIDLEKLDTVIEEFKCTHKNPYMFLSRKTYCDLPEDIAAKMYLGGEYKGCLVFIHRFLPYGEIELR